MRPRWINALGAIVLVAQLLVVNAPNAGAASSTTGPAPVVKPPVVQPLASTNTLHISVSAARSAGSVHQGDPITTYTWGINLDDAGDPTQSAVNCFPKTNPNYPTGCDWPSIHAVLGGTSAGVVTHGNNTQLNGTTGFKLPNGKYVISVQADGFKMDSAHFTVPITSSSGVVPVQLQPYPLSLATVRVRVFNDLMTNGEYDVPGEPGLAGFSGHIADTTGNLVTQDFYGNPICTQYVLGPDGKPILDAHGKPIVSVIGGKCISDAKGDIIIPYLAANRYSATVVPPDGQTWIQTSSLEGGHDWDIWPLEGSTGLSSESIVAGDDTPEVTFGFVQPISLAGFPTSPTNGNASITGGIKGQVMGLAGFNPPAGGLTFGSEAGNKITGPIAYPWLSLMSLVPNEVNVFVGQGNADGTFQLTHVPDGDYVLAAWDADQNMLMESQDVTVVKGQVTDMGLFYVLHWFGILYGTVCVDVNMNGKCDPGEQGIPNLPVQILDRDNSVQDGGIASVNTDSTGHYLIRQTYPLGQWLIEQGYYEHYKTVGVTYQCDSQKSETTVLGTGVDVNFLAAVGLTCRIDWAVTPYAPGTNGGIVGELVYHTTRPEFDPRFAINNPYEAGISGIPVNLYAPVPCPNPIPPGVQCAVSPTSFNSYVLAPDGSYKKGQLLNTYTSEAWQRPTNGSPGAPQDKCIPRDADGHPRTYPWIPTKPNGDCMEAFAMNAQVVTNFGLSGNSTVNGNYGFTTIGFDAQGNPIPPAQQPPLSPGDYIVEPQIPNDSVFNQPQFNVFKEEDVNIFNAPQVVPQLPPMPCAGPLHTVHVTNPAFLSNGGSPFEGQQRPLCTSKLVTVATGRSVTPNFYYFTDVPLPGRFRGIITDDLNLSVNPKELYYGEKAGIPNLALGLYDFSNRQILSTQTDPNGAFEMILPSAVGACPTPGFMCPGMYHFVANDPGIPGNPNPNYNPQYRTITTDFHLWPNVTDPADLAPVPIHLSIEGPPNIQVHPAACTLDPTQPQFWAISPAPYITTANLTNPSVNKFTLTGQGFGATQGAGTVTLGTTLLNVTSWSDRQITVTIPTTVPARASPIQITANNGLKTINGVTFHVLGGSYTPTVFEVGPGKTYATIQSGLEAAAPVAQALVVVYPGTPGNFNPLGAYYENIIIHSPVHLQGLGPGGVYSDGSGGVAGSIIDGTGFENGLGRASAWRALLSTLTWSGNQIVQEGQVVYVLATDAQWTSAYKPAIDGLAIQGGDQLNFPGNINDNGGDPLPLSEREGLEVLIQGGGIFVNGYAHYLQITNDLLQSNGGALGGAIRVGTPFVGDNHNDNLVISNNRIIANGGSNLAGAVGLFNGTTGYDFSYNDMCGNFASEYGGALSHYGYSANGSIHDNRIYYNAAYDHGGALMISGEEPVNPASQLSAGTGALKIFNNIIQANMSNDDGGAIALEQAVLSPIKIFNNFLVNDIATHEGGAVALDASPYVTFDNNTVMKNITTGTSVHGNGLPEPAGLSTTLNGPLLQSILPPGSPTFSNPLMFNNIFWDNRAGAWNGVTIGGIGLKGDPAPINYWDMGVADNSGLLLQPTNTILQTPDTGYIVPDPSNLIGVDPQVEKQFTVTISAFPWRGDPHFVGTITIAQDVPAIRMGNYHLASITSPAKNKGAASKNHVAAPSFDIDYDPRPSRGGFDIGGDQFP